MNVLDIINTAIAEHRTRFAFELLPPLKGDGMQKIFAAVEPLMALDPAYVNITFHREGIKETEREDGSVEWHVVRRRPGTVGISAAIQNRYGVEVVPHLICGGQSRYDLEDALIEVRQAIEMASIYSNIMAGTMDAYASVVSNNLNIIMKVLTILTIIMTIPNIVFGFFGMNIGEGRIPGDWVWWMPLAITVVGCFFAWYMLKKKNLD